MNKSLLLSGVVITLICAIFSVTTYFLVDELKKSKESTPSKPQFLHLERDGGSENCQQKEVSQGAVIGCWTKTRSSSFEDIAVIQGGTEVHFHQGGIFDITGQVAFLAGISNFGLRAAVNNKTCAVYNDNSEKPVPPSLPGYPYTCPVICKNIDILKGQVLTLNALFKGLIHQDAVRNTWDIELKYLF